MVCVEYPSYILSEDCFREVNTGEREGDEEIKNSDEEEDDIVNGDYRGVVEFLGSSWIEPQEHGKKSTFTWVMRQTEDSKSLTSNLMSELLSIENNYPTKGGQKKKDDVFENKY